jgi:hypothetical protein
LAYALSQDGIESKVVAADFTARGP